MTDRIKKTIIEDEMKKSYLDYSMSVIVSRALPDVRDGLKPVHRRVLFSMKNLGLFHDKPFKKSANIIGTCMAKYHPHGDTAIYDSLVRMAQDFSLRYPLVRGQGNFGNIDGDNAAAMRYCITGDSLILTDQGIIPINSISNRKEDRINLKTLSYDGKKNKSSKFFNSGRQKIIKLSTKKGFELEGSYNHPVLVWKLGEDFKPIIYWKTLENLEEGDVLVINRKDHLFSDNSCNLKEHYPTKGFKNEVKLPVKMNNSLAFLLGALVSEGSFHNKQILFNNKDIDFYNKVKSIILREFKGIQLYEREIKGNCKELSIYEQKVVKFLENIGLTNVRSNKKEIPFSILKSKKENVKSFLIGLFEGDGSVTYNKDKRHKGGNLYINYDSNSKTLIKQLKILLLNFGIITSSPYTDKRSNCFKLTISGYDNLERFNKELGFYSRRKKDKLKKIKEINNSRLSKTDFIPFLNDYLRNKYNSSFIKRNNFDRYNSLKKNHSRLLKSIDTNDKKLINWLLNREFYFDQIISLEKLKERKEVFSVKVNSKCHSFIANGFVNHNTEAKLNKLSEEMLKNIDKETVDFRDNYDGSTQEPVVLPSRIPNLLLNGATGIAVGMATNIPPHNLTELCDALIALVENSDLSIDDLAKYIKGPDFPTAGIIFGASGIKEAYKTGRGRVVIKAKADVEERKIIITEIPYQVNKSNLVEAIANLVRDKVVEGISNIRDESDRKGLRVVVELKKNANGELILKQLYKHTSLESSFNINMLALVNDQPKVLDLKSILNYFIKHRFEVITRRCKHDLSKAEKRAHILEGLKIALDNIDVVVALIKKSQSADIAKQNLINTFKLSKEQAQAILDMRLQRLTSLEQTKLKNEYGDLIILIKDLKDILGKDTRVYDLIKKDLIDIKENYGDKRRTEIVESYLETDEESLIKKEEVVITLSDKGYIKRMPLNTYKAQKRGGRGITGASVREEDFIKEMLTCNTHSNILCFSNKGRMYWLKAYNVPEGSRYSKGSAIVNLLKLKDESINTLLSIDNFDDDKFLVFSTQNGIIKKTKLSEFKSLRQGLIAISLKDNDELFRVLLSDGNKEFVLCSDQGKALRFKEKDVNSVGRAGQGVRGIKTKGKVVGFEICDGESLLTVTTNGYGKRSKLEDYRIVGRGGSGVTNIKVTERNGLVSGCKVVNNDDEVMFITIKGIVLRVNVSDISEIGRNTLGFRIMKLDSDDKVVGLTKVEKESKDFTLDGY